MHLGFGTRREVADLVSAGEAAAKTWPLPEDWLRTEWPLWALLAQIEQAAERAGERVQTQFFHQSFEKHEIFIKNH